MFSIYWNLHSPAVTHCADKGLRCAILFIIALTFLVAQPTNGQEKNIRARIERATESSVHIQAGADQGVSVRDTVDAFSETSYLGSLRVVGVSQDKSELAFLDDELLGLQGPRATLNPGDFLYLRFNEHAPTSDRLQAGRPTSLGIHAELQFATVYDSNIDHNDTPVSSYGMVPALKLMVQSSRKDPLLSATYVVARHDYSGSDRWTRTSHMGEIEFEPVSSGMLRPKTSGQISIRGSSEDRDISNEYRIDQDMEFRFSRSQRLVVYGGLVWKRIPESPIDNAFKPRTGLVFQQRGDDGRRWELDVRREWNEEQETRGEYDRWKIETSYRFPMTQSILAQAKVEYRIKSYRDRFVEIEGDDHIRKDNRLTIGAAASSTVWRNVVVQLGYRFETNDSNDPDKQYGAHLVMLVVGYRL